MARSFSAPSRLRGVLALAALLVNAAFALPPGPTLFMVNGGDGMPTSASITTANPDGTSGASIANPGGLLTIPQGIAINASAGKMYVTNEGGDSVTQMNLDGTGPVNLTLGGLAKGPYGIALDVAGNRMFVANGGNNTVIRANLDGSNAVSLGDLGGLLMVPQGMAINVAANKMYVANTGMQNIVQANLDGTGAVGLNFGGMLQTAIPIDVALDVAAGRMYTVDFNTGNVLRADLSGNNAVNLGTLAGTVMQPRGIAVDAVAGKMYVTSSQTNSLTIANVPDGSSPVSVKVATLNNPAMVAVYRTATASVPTVVEYYHSVLDNYFITADPNEQAAVDSGAAGAEWRRTGNTFKTGGPNLVCRFYGSISPGPNSHFYTADANECAALKALQASTPATQKRWNFESNDFATTAASNGACPSNLVPVYRAYNNGNVRGVDSNHRITTSQAGIAQVVAKGWSNEGIVMCAPQ